MGFGTSYSLVYVDCLDWVHTVIYFRIIRGILGCAIAGLVYWGFNSIPAHDNPTRYFFHYVVPSLVLSFFIYGVYPVFCLKVGMVRVRKVPALNDTEASVEGSRATGESVKRGKII